MRDSEYAICPYCGAEHGDCREWVTDQEEVTNCDECGNDFLVYAEYDVTYITEKID